MTIHEALGECLQINHLPRPDGRPLYRYDIAEEALSRLVVLLRDRLRNPLTFNREECAAFCFVLAKRGVPALNADRVTWPAMLLAGLGDPPVHVEGNDCRTFTERGCGWWDRPVIRVAVGYRYLTTLWCEGGGPLTFIQNEYHSIRRYFGEVLRVHMEYPARALDSIIGEEEYLLPKTLRNDLVRDITREVVRKARDIRMLLDANGVGDNPLEWLDNNLPNWRLEWPFVLNRENEAVLEFLSGLLRQQPITHGAAGVAVRTTLERVSQGEFLLRRILVMPATLQRARLRDIARLSDEAVDELPPQQWWRLAVGGNEVDLAKVSRLDNERFKVAVTSKGGLRGDLARGHISLISRRGPITVFPPTAVVGGDALPDSLWVFEDCDEDGVARFVGGGSHSTSRGTLLLASPFEIDAEWIIEGEINRVGTIQDVPGWHVYQLVGNVVFDHGGIGPLHLATNVGGAATRYLCLSGQQLTLGWAGSAVWSGLPRLVEVDEDGQEREEIDQSKLEWRAEGGGEWQQIGDPDQCLGTIQIRYRGENSVVLYRQAITVLPRGFTIRSGRMPFPQQGRVLLGGMNPMPDVVAAEFDGVNVDVGAQANLLSLTVTCTASVVPPAIRCRLSWPANRTAEVDIGTPLNDAAIVDAAGRRCFLPGPVPVGLLDGLFLRGTFAAGGSPTLVDDSDVKWAGLDPETAGSVSFSLPLSTIGERCRGGLAAKGWNGGFVQLYLRQNENDRTNQRHFRVERSAGQVNYKDVVVDDNVLAVVWVPRSVLRQPWCQGTLTLEINRLAHFDEPLPDDLSLRRDERSWVINRRLVPSEGVLVTVRGSSGITLSPRFVSPLPAVGPLPAGDAAPAEMEDGQRPRSFDEVVGIQGDARRFLAWTELLEDMVKDPAHGDWGELERLLQGAIHLPETTFNVVEAIASLPSAAAACAVRHSGLPGLWPFLERLTFLWSLVSIETWIQAACRYATFLEGRHAGMQMGRLAIKHFLSTALRESPCCMPIIADSLASIPDLLTGEDRRQLGGVNGTIRNIPQVFLRQQVVILANGLISDARGARWPDANQSEIMSSPTLKGLLDTFGIVTEYLGPRLGYRRSVMCAPLIAACHVVAGDPISEHVVRDLIRCRSFHRDWYDEIHRIGVYYLVRQRLDTDPNWVIQLWN